MAMCCHYQAFHFIGSEHRSAKWGGGGGVWGGGGGGGNVTYIVNSRAPRPPPPRASYEVYSGLNGYDTVVVEQLSIFSFSCLASLC